MSRFEGAPKQMDARSVFPNADSMIVLDSRIARGIEGTLDFGLYRSVGF